MRRTNASCGCSDVCTLYRGFRIDRKWSDMDGIPEGATVNGWWVRPPSGGSEEDNQEVPSSLKTNGELTLAFETVIQLTHRQDAFGLHCRRTDNLPSTG